MRRPTDGSHTAEEIPKFGISDVYLKSQSRTGHTRGKGTGKNTADDVYGEITCGTLLLYIYPTNLLFLHTVIQFFAFSVNSVALWAAEPSTPVRRLCASGFRVQTIVHVRDGEIGGRVRAPRGVHGRVWPRCKVWCWESASKQAS